MHCKPNPLENGKRSGQLRNSTQCTCDARHQHWNIQTDTNHNLNQSLIFTKKQDYIHTVTMIKSEHTKALNQTVIQSAWQISAILTSLFTFYHIPGFPIVFWIGKQKSQWVVLIFPSVREYRRLTTYSGAAHCQEMNRCNRSLNKSTYLRFLSARLLLVESPHCFLLGGPTWVFTAPVAYLGLLISWLARWLTLSGLTVMPVRSEKVGCKGVFPVWEARIVTWVKNILGFNVWLFLSQHVRV